MPRSTNDYLNAMIAALGKTPNSRHPLIADLNDAGRALFNIHPWTWRNRAGARLTFAAGAETCELPDDFGEAIEISLPSESPSEIIQTTLGDIIRRREEIVPDPLVTYIAFGVGRDQPAGGRASPVKIAHIYPTPEEGRTDILLAYRAVWAELAADDLERVPNIPLEYERALLLLSRAFAIHLEDQTDPIEDVQFQREIARLIDADARIQTNYGQPTHSVWRNRGVGTYRPHRRIAFGS